MKKLIFVLFVLLLIGTAHASLTTDLVSYYKLDETTGAVLDAHGTNDGTNNGATTNVTGKINTAYDFDGTNDNVGFGHSFNTGDAVSFSVTGWVNPDVVNTNNQKIISQDEDNTNRGIQIYIDSSGQLAFANGSIILTGTQTFSVDSWQFFTVTYDGSGNLKLYVNDGSTSHASVSVVTDTSNPLEFGSRSFSTEAFFDGSIDEVAIFSRDLSSDEVTELYNGGSGLTYPFSINSVDANFDFTIDKVNEQIILEDTSTVIGAVEITDWNYSVNDSLVSNLQDYNYSTSELTDLNVCLFVDTNTTDVNDTQCYSFNTGDWTPPVTTFSSSQVSGTTDQNITLSCTDNNSGCATINFSINNGDWNYYTIGDNPLTIIYSGAGDHNIQYYSTDVSDNNETTNTSTFTTYGLASFTFYDENSSALLNDVTYTISPSIGGDSGATLTDSNTLDLNLQGITSQEYTFTFSLEDYGTRYYTTDLNEFSDIDTNFLMLPTSLGQNIEFKFFAPDKTTILSNSWITITNKDINNFTTGRIQTDALGKATYFLDANTGAHEFNITETPTGINYDYNSISVIINQPKDEDTSNTITDAWDLTISGVTASTYLDLTVSSTTLALYTNTVNDYIFQIDSNSTTPEYSSRKYYINFPGNDDTYTLQPYLLASATPITIYAQNSLLNPLSDVTMDIYRVTSEGYTLVEQVQTDASGSAGVSLKANQDYFFDVYYQGDQYFDKERKQIISSEIYFILSVEEETEYTDTNKLNLTFIPGYSQLSTISYDRIIYMNPICTGLTITSFDVNVTQKISDTNTIILYHNLESSNVCNMQQSFNIDDDMNIDADSNNPIKVLVTIVSSDDTHYFEKSYYVLTSTQEQYNLIYILQNNLFEDFGCQRTGNPEIDLIRSCPTLLLIIAGILLFTGVFLAKKVNVDKIGILLLIELGFFTFLGWFPLAMYALIVLGSIILIGVRNFNW